MPFYGLLSRMNWKTEMKQNQKCHMPVIDIQRSTACHSREFVQWFDCFWYFASFAALVAIRFDCWCPTATTGHRVCVTRARQTGGIVLQTINWDKKKTTCGHRIILTVSICCCCCWTAFYFNWTKCTKQVFSKQHSKQPYINNNRHSHYRRRSHKSNPYWRNSHRAPWLRSWFNGYVFFVFVLKYCKL